MGSVGLSARGIERQARRHASDQVVQLTSPWSERLGRFGHVVIGLVYVAALHRRSDEVRGPGGALATFA